MIRNASLWRLGCVFVLLAGLVVDGARAAESPAKPRRVDASFFFGMIENADSVNESFNADFYLRMQWTDPSLASLPPEKIDLGAIWEPKIEVINSRDLGKPWDPYIQLAGPGKLSYLGRFQGSFAAPMDLHDFPFDHQVLPIEIESTEYTSRQFVFSYPNQRDEQGWTTPVKPEEVLGSGVRLPEWKIEAVQVRELDKYYAFMDSSYSRYRIEILVSRRSGFYFWKVIVIEALIVALSWVVFLLDAGELGNRSAVSVTLLLATVAFSYVVSGITPRISYLTLLDWFLFGSFVLIFLSCLETAVVYLLRRRGMDAAGTLRIDRWSLAVFPVIFLLFNVLLWARVVAARLA